MLPSPTSIYWIVFATGVAVLALGIVRALTILVDMLPYVANQ